MNIEQTSEKLADFEIIHRKRARLSSVSILITLILSFTITIFRISNTPDNLNSNQFKKYTEQSVVYASAPPTLLILLSIVSLLRNRKKYKEEDKQFKNLQDHYNQLTTQAFQEFDRNHPDLKD